MATTETATTPAKPLAELRAEMIATLEEALAETEAELATVFGHEARYWNVLASDGSMALGFRGEGEIGLLVIRGETPRAKTWWNAEVAKGEAKRWNAGLEGRGMTAEEIARLTVETVPVKAALEKVAASVRELIATLKAKN